MYVASKQRTCEGADGVTPLWTIVKQWSRIGVTGFGGPPAHIALLRDLCVHRQGWLTEAEFEDGVAATALLPGPASTQLAVYCAWRLRGALGALIGGVCFITPGLIATVALSAVVLAHEPSRFVLGAAAGAGAAVAAVAVRAGSDLVPASWRRVGHQRAPRIRWAAYAVLAGLTTIVLGAWVVVAIVAAGLIELGVRRGLPVRPAVPILVGVSGLTGLAWTALKVGALSYGGGFVIIPLMQSDAVDRYHWMTGSQFLSAVVLGQLTPGPVTHTVAVVGFAAAGVGGALLAAAIAFAPSFVFVMAGASRLQRLRNNESAQCFLTGAGGAAIGAILGSSVRLGLELTHLWQVGVLAAAAVWLLALRRGVVSALLGCAVIGLLAALVGLPVA
jgi:chromate transporter